MPFSFEPAHLIRTVCGCTGTGSACDSSSCTPWREEHLRGATRYPRPIQKRFCRPRASTHYSAFDSALNGMRDAKLLLPIRGPHRQVFVCGVEVKAASHDVGDVQK